MTSGVEFARAEIQYASGILASCEVLFDRRRRITLATANNVRRQLYDCVLPALQAAMDYLDSMLSEMEDGEIRHHVDEGNMECRREVVYSYIRYSKIMEDLHDSLVV